VTDALAVHYAQALADSVFAADSGIRPEEAIEQLRTAAELFAGSVDFHRILQSPAVAKSAKSAVVGKIADQLQFSRLLRNFLMVIVNHRRTAEIPRIVEAFEDAVDRHLGFERAEIIAAAELTDEQKRHVEDSLAQKSGKRIRPVYQIDPSLIGGLIARLGSREYDGSLRGRLEAMRRRLAAAS
jgi:F-type H+-transporting ATPase subunit delta